MRALILLTLCIAAVSAVPYSSQRIVGGSVTTIDRYPAIAAVLQAIDSVNFRQVCGSSVLNQRSVLTAAHCLASNATEMYRIRVGSTWANSGGATHNIATIIMHPNWSTWTLDSDLAIFHTTSGITYSNVVQPAFIAGVNYNVSDNQAVWAAGWGVTAIGASWSEQLQHVQFWTISRSVCTQQYGSIITNNMFCAGAPNGGLSTCQGDSGGPLYHQGVVIGVTSFGGPVCGDRNRHGVYVQINRFTSWIQNNS